MPGKFFILKKTLHAAGVPGKSQPARFCW